MTPPSVDIIVISWNGKDDTLRALDAVVSQAADSAATGSRVGITVIDNGSSDGTGVEILRRFPQVRVVRLHENRGFTGGIAKGVEVSTADFLIFLNNDAVPEPGWLKESIRGLAESGPDVAAVSGRIIDISGTRNDFSGGLLTFDGHAFQSDFRRPLSEVAEPADGAELLFACGGNMIVRRLDFLRLGGFDNDYFAYLEDVDFGWRAWLSGSRILYNRRAVVRHRSSATSDRLGSFERGVLFERNALRTAIKNYEDEVWKELAGPVFLTYLHRLQHYTVQRNGGAWPLARPAFGEKQSAATARTPLRHRLARALLGREAAIIDDPLTMMQFRALARVFEEMEPLAAKRRLVQSMRKRPDREIFERFPLHVVATYPGDPALMDSVLFRGLAPSMGWTRKTLEEIMQS